MKTNLLAIITFAILTCILTFNYITVDPNKPLDLSVSDSDLESQKDIQFIKEVEHEEIATACLLLTRNSIVGNRSNLDKLIKSTNFNKEVIFDKLVVSMMKNCLKNLDLPKAKTALSVENVTDLLSPLLYVLDPIDQSAIENEPSFDENELKLLKLIYGVHDNKVEARDNNSSHKESNNKVEEDLLSAVLTELETTQTKYIIYGMMSSFFSCLFLWYVLGGFTRKKRVLIENSTVISSKKRNN